MARNGWSNGVKYCFNLKKIFIILLQFLTLEVFELNRDENTHYFMPKNLKLQEINIKDILLYFYYFHIFFTFCEVFFSTKDHTAEKLLVLQVSVDAEVKYE